MSQQPTASDFLPAGRDAPPEIARQSQILKGWDLFTALDMLPLAVLILNSKRQIVFANQRFNEFSNHYHNAIPDLGPRLGEALSCVHSAQNKGGCGTTRNCRYCGAAQAILASLEGRHEVLECRITRTENEALAALNVQFFSSPFEIGGENFVLACMLDVVNEKRLRMFERIFYHDVLNTSSGIYNLCEILDAEIGKEFKSDTETLLEASSRLIDQIKSQKELAAAEKKEMLPVWTKLGTKLILLELKDFFQRQSLAQGKEILVDPQSRDIYFETDKSLLYRVISNLMKNALEATPLGGVITVSCKAAPAGVLYEVHNSGHMPEEVQLQLFKRFFTTKGNGRGLGTYGAKLLTQDYLGGELSFSSTPEQGTKFTVSLGLSAPSEKIRA